MMDGKKLFMGLKMQYYRYPKNDMKNDSGDQ